MTNKTTKTIAVLCLICIAAGTCLAQSQDEILSNARSLVEKKDYPAALAQYETIGEGLWSNPDLVIEWARAYTYANQHAEAIDLFEQIIEKFPEKAPLIGQELNNQRAFITLGNARGFVEKKDYSAALAQYQKISEWIWNYPSLVIEWARVYTYANQHAEAVELFEQFNQKFPDQTEMAKGELKDQQAYIIINDARELVAKKDYSGALEKYEMISEWLWKDPGLVIERARVYSYAGRHEEAVSLFKKVIEKYPGKTKEIKTELINQQAFLTLNNARELVGRKNYPAAIKEYKKIDDWLWRDTGLVIERARVYAYADRMDDAEDLLEEIRKRSPESAEKISKELDALKYWILLEKARTLVQKSNFAGALEQYEKISGFLWHDPGLVIEWARVNAYANRHQAAIDLYEKVIEKHPDQAPLIEQELQDQKNYITLQKAQNLVEGEDYEGALEEYGKIKDWLWREPELAIEHARVHSYADKHSDAVELFEAIRKKYPERENEFLRELADMYTYDNQIKKAISTYNEAIEANNAALQSRLGRARALVWVRDYKQALEEYDAILEDYPNLVEAMTGKAYALSWMDRLEESKELYEKVREIDPGNFSARIGLARVMVWQGYHRKGIKQYLTILDTEPENLDAMEGLAFALHWDDRSGEAVDVLHRLNALRSDRREAGKLMYEIKFAKKPYIIQDNEYERDSIGRQVQTHRATVGVPLNFDTTVEGLYQLQRVQDNDFGTVNTHTTGVGIHSRLNEQFRVDSLLYGTTFDRRSWEAFTTDTKLTWAPDDFWRFRLGYDRETFTDVEAILNQIVVDSYSIKTAFRPDRFWLFSGKFKQGMYSDSNRQDSVLAMIEYRFTHDPFIKMYYNYYFSNWHTQKGHGYFNPKNFQSHTVGVYISKKISPKLFVEGQVSLGYETHTPRICAPTIFYAGGIRYRLDEQWFISARGEYFKAWEDNFRDSDGYVSSRAMLTLGYSFGPGGEEEPEPGPFDTIRMPDPSERSPSR